MNLWDKIKNVGSVQPDEPSEHTPVIPPEPPAPIEFEFDDEPKPDLNEPEVPVKRGRGRPKGATNKYKGLLTDEQRARLRARDNTETKKAKAAAEKERRLIMRAEATERALTLPIPEALLAPKAKTEEKLYVRDAIEKVIALAQAAPDKTRLEALLDRAYLLAMDESTDLETLLKVIKLIAERMEAAPTNKNEEGGGTSSPNLTININATRFQARPVQDGGVIDVEDVTSA